MDISEFKDQTRLTVVLALILIATILGGIFFIASRVNSTGNGLIPIPSSSPEELTSFSAPSPKAQVAGQATAIPQPVRSPKGFSVPSLKASPKTSPSLSPSLSPSPSPSPSPIDTPTPTPTPESSQSPSPSPSSEPSPSPSTLP